MRSTILVVDDDDFTRQYIRTVLERAGWGVAEAASSAAALALRPVEPFALAAIDFNLPDGNGRQLARDLRRQHPVLPLLLLSGDADCDTAGLFVAALQKPFRPKELERAVAAALPNHAA